MPCRPAISAIAKRGSPWAISRRSTSAASRHRALIDRIWKLRASVTPYDAAYVALAEALAVTLITADARLARATGPRCTIELLASA